mmetsp:Transcript_10863/g.47046  ORF Transcript_10863/g.47046 Transcript_10863/m.47046 type:complete len:370 (-) Transcript_10863:303-1412(-)
MISVVTELRKSRSCDTTSRVFFHRVRYSSSQITALRSRWLVGSSRSRHVGSMNRALAREMRMRQPPENDLVVLNMLNRSGPVWVPSFFAMVNPRPWRILLALASAVASFFSSSFSYVLFSSSARSKLSAVSSAASSRAAFTASTPSRPPWVSASSLSWHAARASASAASRSLCPSSPPLSSALATRSIAASSSSLRLRRFMSSTSAATTDSSAVRSSPTTSCSTSRMSIKSGTGSLRLARSFMMVVLPMPLGPTRPYFLPWTMVMLVLLRSSLPLAATLKPSILMSLELAMSSLASSLRLAHLMVNASSSSCMACSLAIASLRAASSSFWRALRSSFSVLTPRTISFSSLTMASVSSSLPLEGKSMSSM